MSTGRFGAELAQAFANQHINTVFFHEKNSAKPTDNQEYIKYIKYNSYDNYLGVKELTEKEKPDIIISAAAVSDYTFAKAEGKLSSDEDELIIRLKKAKKVLPLLKAASPDSMVVGFKLLVNPAYDQVFKAVQKVLNNGADYVVYNDLDEIKKGNNERLIFKKDISFVKVSDAKQLSQYITNEYSTWPNGQRGI